ncbi:MAG: chemotaxis protein CheX [Syntrophus sp. (in: bacteria)]|nr:chemotaxis protein CheX [Syntrophus sp. (in: bacteria)]
MPLSCHLMNVEYINPFIDATRKLMEVMVGIKQFRKREITLDQQIKAAFDISAIIGVTGSFRGSIILSFSSSVAVAMITSLLGEPVDEFDDDVCDAVSEMVNIITGNAQAMLAENGYGNFERSLPNVIVGKGHVINRPQNTPCINIFFDTELGGFAMQVSLKET